MIVSGALGEGKNSRHKKGEQFSHVLRWFDIIDRTNDGLWEVAH